MGEGAAAWEGQLIWEGSANKAGENEVGKGNREGEH